MDRAPSPIALCLIVTLAGCAGDGGEDDGGTGGGGTATTSGQATAASSSGGSVAASTRGRQGLPVARLDADGPVFCSL